MNDKISPKKLNSLSDGELKVLLQNCCDNACNLFEAAEILSRVEKHLPQCFALTILSGEELAKASFFALKILDKNFNVSSHNIIYSHKTKHHFLEVSFPFLLRFHPDSLTGDGEFRNFLISEGHTTNSNPELGKVVLFNKKLKKLATIFTKNADLYKIRGFYVDMLDSGTIKSPIEASKEQDLREVLQLIGPLLINVRNITVLLNQEAGLPLHFWPTFQITLEEWIKELKAKMRKDFI